MTARLCLALDSRDRNEIERLAQRTAAEVDAFKVGLTAFVAHGDALVQRLAAIRPVFLDLKLHDIPAQVAGAVGAAAATGATYLTIHASGGAAMMEAAAEAARTAAITLLAVTILTSLDERDLEDLGLAATPATAVVRLAHLARRAGVPGLVCSPREVASLRTAFGAAPDGPILVVPGIRAAAGDDDQRRTMAAGDAAAAGADLLVVGRPITGAPDPLAAAAAIRREIRERS